MNPYFNNLTDGLSDVSNTSNYTQYIYDALDRVVSVINPDGTSKRVTFEQRNITDYDENNHKHMYVLDGLGRIINVYEYNNNPLINATETYITAYSYDGNDNLINILDNEGHLFTFKYDSLSRKIGMIDPDMGNWSYSYDMNNNLVKQVDSKNNMIAISYDQLNRFVNKNSNDYNTTFIYDQQYYGTLSRILANTNYINYTYDKRMRVSSEIQYFNNGASLIVENYPLYDSADRIIYSNGLYYNYNNIGKVSTIQNILNATFNPLGQIKTRTYNNGLVQTFTYSFDNSRLTNIAIPNV